MRPSWDFPGSPVVKTPCFQCRAQQARSLVGELNIPQRIRKSNKSLKKKKKKNEAFLERTLLKRAST